MLCHLITGLRQFYHYMSSVTYYLFIGAFLATLCVHDILYFTFMVTFQFVFIFHIIFMFHEHSYTICISYIFHVTITYGISHTCKVKFLCIHTSFMYSNPSMNLFYLEIRIIPIGSSKLKLWHIHTKLVNLPILPEGQFEILIFQCLDSIFDSGSLYSFKLKVLRVLLQLESPKSKH